MNGKCILVLTAILFTSVGLAAARPAGEADLLFVNGAIRG